MSKILVEEVRNKNRIDENRNNYTDYNKIFQNDNNSKWKNNKKRQAGKNEAFKQSRSRC